jgi:HEAT repeat protein
MIPRTFLAAAALWLGAAATAPAQTLAARIAAAPDGDVRLVYSSRPDVWGDGHNVIQWNCRGENCRRGVDDNSSDDDWRSACDTGPVRLTLRVRGGRVTALHAVVGGAWRPRSGVTDLGRVPAGEASRYLLALARQSEGEIGGQAVFAATLADSVTVWPDLLRLARDPDAPGETRRSAVFWVSQAAEEAATRGLDSLAGDGGVDREVREQAVFALSQRPKDEGVPALIRIATTHTDPEIRRRAIFWLGQSNDPRALELFEALLTRP